MKSETASWISGLMRENYDAVGFIPEPTLNRQYVEKDRCIFQKDNKGKQVGYLLHGALLPGRAVHVAQACILHEKRLLDFGTQAVDELAQRAESANASSIRLRCAEDLEALHFWIRNGFSVEGWEAPDNKRKRRIIVLSRPLALPLFRMPPCEKNGLLV